MSVQYVGSLAVPVTSAAPQASTFTLDSDRTYRVVASGTATIHTNANPALQKVTDAEYVLRPTGPDTFGRSGATVTDNGLQLGGVGGFAGWGAYAADHIYSVDVTGSGGPLTAYYRDVVPSSYGDNAGSLTLDVYEVTGSVTGRAAIVADGVPTDVGVAGVTVQVIRDNAVVGATVTDADGYYEIANLPAGDYTLTATGPADAPYFSLPVGGKPIAITDTPLVEDVPIEFDTVTGLREYIDLLVPLKVKANSIKESVKDIEQAGDEIADLENQIANAANQAQVILLTNALNLAKANEIAMRMALLVEFTEFSNKLPKAKALYQLIGLISPATLTDVEKPPTVTIPAGMFDGLPIA